MTSTSGAPNGRHAFPVRVYYEDTDAGGMVYYANYLKFAERARSELLRELGIRHGRREDGVDYAFAVRRCRADYLKPARLDDDLRVITEIEEVRGASIAMRQTVRRDTVDLVRLDVLIACLDGSGGPMRLPEEVRARLREFGQGNEKG